MKGTKLLISIAVFTLSYCASAQRAKETRELLPNLIPNHSFEEFSEAPLGWFYNGAQFTRLVKYWKSPTLASPDAFGPGIVVPTHWKKKGFGAMVPFRGSAMVGITVYGCADGKPHCREYLQVPLNESLVPGQGYEITYSVAHLKNSLWIDKLGVMFSIEPLDQSDDGIIQAEPHVFCEEIVMTKKDRWKTISHDFIADDKHSYLILGNFFSDSLNVISRKDATYEFAYYYVDEIVLKKVPPFVEQKLSEDDLSLQPLEVGKRIQLKNIYFDLDKSDLLPRSFVELDKLELILLQNPSMTIEIHGHTDIQGESDYNLQLSVQRSRSVMQYLIDSGISSDRMASRGYGSNVPIANNTVVSGRKLNRRVEILITGL